MKQRYGHFLMLLLAVPPTVKQCNSPNNTGPAIVIDNPFDDPKPVPVPNPQPGPAPTDVSTQYYALVIGNADYQEAGMVLETPVNDAELVAEKLEAIGYKVFRIFNANRAEFYNRVETFLTTLRNNENSVGLFYYAGHGFENEGTNYLLPVDVALASVKQDGYKLGDLVAGLENVGSRLNLIFIDACRNSLPNRRGVSRGMTVVNAKAGSELFIGFSTMSGETAQDAASSNADHSPFALAFVENASAQKEVAVAFRQITGRVKSLTGDQQVPWQGGSLSKEFYILPAANPNNPSPTNNTIVSPGS